jgi:hypothetical protein
MSDEKDRFGDKLHEVEKAREDQWAADHDRQLIDKLRQKRRELQSAAEGLKEAVAEATDSLGKLCPHCEKPLTLMKREGISAWTCPSEAGVWLERQSLEALLERAKTPRGLFWRAKSSG